MTEKEWVGLVIKVIQNSLSVHGENFIVSQAAKLTYASEIRSYAGNDPQNYSRIAYETDILISEYFSGKKWKPRIVIEAKLGSITTHDAITYSQKASTHKNVHPYLRYGILIGDRQHYPLPGRLFRHGAYFDFMLSWEVFEPSAVELSNLLEILTEEVQASRHLEEIIYNSRSRNRKRYTFLHRPLRLK
jgi:hypothetical protein